MFLNIVKALPRYPNIASASVISRLVFGYFITKRQIINKLSTNDSVVFNTCS